MKTVVSERGQVTIPKPIRHSLGIRAGQELDVREEGGHIVMTKRVAEDVWDRVTGILESDKSTDELIEEMRGPADFR